MLYVGPGRPHVGPPRVWTTQARVSGTCGQRARCPRASGVRRSERPRGWGAAVWRWDVRRAEARAPQGRPPHGSPAVARVVYRMWVAPPTGSVRGDRTRGLRRKRVVFAARVVENATTRAGIRVLLSSRPAPPVVGSPPNVRSEGQKVAPCVTKKPCAEGQKVAPCVTKKSRDPERARLQSPAKELPTSETSPILANPAFGPTYLASLFPDARGASKPCTETEPR